MIKHVKNQIRVFPVLPSSPLGMGLGPYKLLGN